MAVRKAVGGRADLAEAVAKQAVAVTALARAAAMVVEAMALEAKEEERAVAKARYNLRPRFGFPHS